MIDRVMLTADDMKRAKLFYETALAPLGYRLMEENEWELGFGIPPKADVWVQSGPQSSIQIRLTLRAENRQQVEDFWKAAMGAGGYDNGPPYERPEYGHSSLYGASVCDPAGHSIEVVYYT